MEYLILIGIGIAIFYWLNSKDDKSEYRSRMGGSSNKYSRAATIKSSRQSGIDRNVALEKWRTNLKSRVATNPLTVRLKYRKRGGEYSDRVVDINEIHESSGKIYISGYCTLRKENRTFREDRVIQIVDVGTGEVFGSIDEFVMKIR